MRKRRWVGVEWQERVMGKVEGRAGKHPTEFWVFIFLSASSHWTVSYNNKNQVDSLIEMMMTLALQLRLSM